MSKNINLDIFDKFPLIQDSIASKLNKNVFLVKGDEVKRSLYSGNLELSYPYFECLMPMNERIDFFLEGKGRAVEVIPGCEQAECSYDPIVLDGAKEDVLLGSITFRSDDGECLDDDSCGRTTNDVEDIQTEAEKAVGTSKNVDMFRKYKYCPEDGNTTVEITIRAKEDITDFRFFENIPKGCVNDLVDFVFKIYPVALVSVQNRTDPLIMWYFSSLQEGEEKKISYEINKKLDDLNCREVIEGLGIAEEIDGTDSEDGIDTADIPPEIDTTNNPPVLSLSPSGDQSFSLGGSIYAIDVTATDVDNSFSDLIFTATNIPPGLNWVEDTVNEKWVLSGNPSSAGDYEIEFTVTDTGTPTKTDDEEVKIEVTATCIPDIQDYFGCFSNQIWWFDDCDDRYQHVVSCATATCTPDGTEDANCNTLSIGNVVECDHGSGTCENIVSPATCDARTLGNCASII